MFFYIFASLFLNLKVRLNILMSVWKILSCIGVAFSFIVSFLQLFAWFFPREFPNVIKYIGSFIINNWLILIVIGLLLVIINLLINRHSEVNENREQQSDLI
jgi:uncharacterized membrane protein